MGEKNGERRFGIEFQECGWYRRHIGVCLCVEPNDKETGVKGDKYLFICLWKYEISIGFLTRWED